MVKQIFEISQSTTVEVGSLVIVNEVDRPCLRLLAVVTEIENDGMVRCSYIERGLTREDTAYRNMLMPADRMTPVGNFGVRVLFTRTSANLVCYGWEPHNDPFTQATYRNGKPREWQDSLGACEICTIKSLEKIKTEKLEYPVKL